MSTLVLAPSREACADWCHELFAGTELVFGDRARGCTAIVVINDHSAEVVRLLQRARELCNDRQGLPVAMLTAVDGTDIEALIRLLGTPASAACVPTGQALAALVAERLPAEVRVGSQAINFEYDA